MRTIKLYHGTNASDVNNVLDCPKATKNINGLGFYCTLDLEVAKQFGSKICVWEVEASFLDKFESIIRPIDQRYVEGLETYDECARNGIEVVLSQQVADLMSVYCEDAFVL